ncbi:MAG TPA: hypothetical protein VFQ43_19090 [Nitrososphaera sp.]|nr:hypothetical protein [Nitrososphaera sp.]
MSKSYTNAHVTSQQGATRALIKFCEDHGYDVGGVEQLRVCLTALDRNDIKSAVEAYLRVPLGGMGCFDDWLPPTVFPEETPDYVRSVFESLVTRWSLLMRLSLPKN